MSMKMFDSIDSLQEGKYDWNLRVRVVREWDSYSSKAGKEFKGKNLLFLDDKVMSLSKTHSMYEFI